MRVGLIADLHSNWPALEAVAADMPDVDALVCAGDIVGYYPWPGACVDWIRDRDIPTVMGNHDRMVAGEGHFPGNHMAQAGERFARESLTEDQLSFLAQLPDRRRCLDGRVRIAHGHPEDPDRYTYPPEFDAHMLDGEELLVLGHTHVPGIQHTPKGTICNPGSVGQPRDGDPRAAYAIADLESREVALHRVEYDIERVVNAVTDAGLPERVGKRLWDGK